jgi:hypothetical protein
MSGSYDIDVSVNRKTDYYNKYLLNNPQLKNEVFMERKYSPASDHFVKNVLKDKFSLNYSDYEKLKLAEQYNKLYNNSMMESEKLKNIQENQKFYNMSLKELWTQASKVYIEIINELSNFFTYPNNKNLNQLGYIFTKKDHLLYIGLLFVILAFSLWMIDISS